MAVGPIFKTQPNPPLNEEIATQPNPSSVRQSPWLYNQLESDRKWIYDFGRNRNENEYFPSFSAENENETASK